MIKIHNLSKIVHQRELGDLHILKDVSLEILTGEFVSIVGKSGAGKTTLLNVLGLLEPFETGDYWFENTKITWGRKSDYSVFRNQKIGYVMQNFQLIDDYTVMENVLMPLDFSAMKLSKKEKIKKVSDAIQKVGLENKMRQKCRTLSGGEKQRTAIARAIVNEPQIILADEPTGALDQNNEDKIFELLKTINDMGVTVIIVTHDSDLASKCDRCIRICDGEIVV